jgi:hypothetical protein
MCKVSPFSRAQVKAFRRVIDFCYWRGIPIARKWPEWHYPAASLKQLEFQNVMRVSRVFLKEIDPALIAFWHNIFQGKKPSWIDRYTSQFISAYQLLGAEIPPVVKQIQFDHMSPDLQVSFNVSGEGEYSVAALRKPLVQEITYKKTKGIAFPCYDAYYPQPLIEKAAYLVPTQPPIMPNLIAAHIERRWAVSLGDTIESAIAASWADLQACDWYDVSFEWPRLLSYLDAWGGQYRVAVEESRGSFTWDFSAYPKTLVDQCTHIGIGYPEVDLFNEIFPHLPASQIDIKGNAVGTISLYPFSSPALVAVPGGLSYPEVNISISTNPAVYGFTYTQPYTLHGWVLNHVLSGEFTGQHIYKAEFYQDEVQDELDDLFYLVYITGVRAPIILPVPYNTDTIL